MDAQEDTINPSLIKLLPDGINWLSPVSVTSLTLQPSSDVGNSFVQRQPSVKKEGEFTPSSLFNFGPDEELPPVSPHIQAVSSYDFCASITLCLMFKLNWLSQCGFTMYLAI
jgi:hypothetical protein